MMTVKNSVAGGPAITKARGSALPFRCGPAGTQPLMTVNISVAGGLEGRS